MFKRSVIRQTFFERSFAIVAPMAALFASGALANEMNFQFISLDDSYIGYERDVADVNKDGANDVVCVSEKDNLIRVFLAPDWTAVVLATPTGAYTWPRADDFKAADIDGDGDADLVVGLGATSNGTTAIAAWFENQSPSNWVQHTIGSVSDYVKDICVADLDRDGRLDVVMRQDAETKAYFQEVSGWTPVTLSHPAHEGMEVADLDGDGDPDIILNGFWFLTPNTPSAARVAANYTNITIDAAWYNQSGDWTANSCKVAAGDMDGDGNPEVIFSHSERTDYPVTWYRSITPTVAGTWTAHPVEVVDYCHTLQAADWDLDGNTDLLVGGMTSSQHRGLKLLLNDGTGTNWSAFVVQSDGSYSAETGDIDNDGDPDIVGIRDWDSAPTYIYRNNAAGGPSLDFWFYHQISSTHTLTFGLCFPDIDHDGDLDIASGRHIYRNPGSPMTGSWTQITLPASVHAFAAVDVDGDSLTDLMALQDNPANSRIDIYWVEAANASGSAWATPVRVGEVPRSDHTEGFQGYRVAEISGGGRPEIVVSTMQGIYYFSIPGTNPESGNWPRTVVAANDSDEGIGIADLDGDGDLDIAFTRGADKQVRWARNPGDGSGNWSVFAIGSFPEADWPDRCDAVDLNGDGRADIAVTEENSGASADALACWWEQPASGATNGSWTRHTVTTRYTLNSMDAADVDRDGSMDLVLAEHRGDRRISVWQNNGSGGFTEKPVGQGHESHLGGKLADLDADGDLDLVSIAYDAYTDVHLWRNDSPGGVPTVARPTISPNGGVFDEPLSATLSCSTSGAELWYTLNGSTPTNQPPSMLYSNTPISIATSQVVKVRGFKTDHQPSPVVSATFTGPQVKTPVFSPSGGTFSATQEVAISCATTGVTIRFTTNGADPQTSDPVYTTPLTLTNTTTLKARAWRSGLEPSSVASASFIRFTVGAIAHWRLDERFGLLAADSSGFSRTGTVSGATWTTGIRDNALAFDGTDDRVECGTWSVGGTSLTITAWIRLDPSYVDDDNRILSKATGHIEPDHWWMLSTTVDASNRRLRARLKAGGSTVTLIANSGNLVLNEWTHVAASYNGASLSLFVNGASVGSVAKTGDLDESGSAAIWIGANPPDVYAAFKGKIDDVRIYNIAMDATAVSAVMNEVPPPLAPRFLNHTKSTNDHWSFTASGNPGHHLYLQRSTNLLSGQWQNIVTQSLIITPAILVDTNRFNKAFYRLLLD